MNSSRRETDMKSPSFGKQQLILDSGSQYHFNLSYHKILTILLLIVLKIMGWLTKLMACLIWVLKLWHYLLSRRCFSNKGMTGLLLGKNLPFIIAIWIIDIAPIAIRLAARSQQMHMGPRTLRSSWTFRRMMRCRGRARHTAHIPPLWIPGWKILSFLLCANPWRLTTLSSLSSNKNSGCLKANLPNVTWLISFVEVKLVASRTHRTRPRLVSVHIRTSVLWYVLLMFYLHSISGVSSLL